MEMNEMEELLRHYENEITLGWLRQGRLSYGRVPEKQVITYALQQGIRHNQLAFVQYLLNTYDPDIPSIRFMEAARYSSVAMFALLYDARDSINVMNIDSFYPILQTALEVQNRPLLKWLLENEVVFPEEVFRTDDLDLFLLMYSRPGTQKIRTFSAHQLRELKDRVHVIQPNGNIDTYLTSYLAQRDRVENAALSSTLTSSDHVLHVSSFGKRSKHSTRGKRDKRSKRKSNFLKY